MGQIIVIIALQAAIEHWGIAQSGSPVTPLLKSTN